MATKLKISDFNQAITVKLKTTTEGQAGNTVSNWNTTRFQTNYANLKVVKSQQGYSEGVSEKDTYYMLRYAYQSDRAIAISDKIFWGSKELKPVGDCVLSDYGDKRVWEQKVKYTSS